MSKPAERLNDRNKGKIIMEVRPSRGHKTCQIRNEAQARSNVVGLGSQGLVATLQYLNEGSPELTARFTSSIPSLILDFLGMMFSLKIKLGTSMTIPNYVYIQSNGLLSFQGV
ncbi:unnamed protein product, partial [Owenia fusiformis]